MTGYPPRNPFACRTPRQFCEVLIRHRRKAIAFFAGTMGLVVLALVLMPRTYVSEARLFVRLGRESVTLDPTATTGQMVPVHESREAEIASVLDVLRSRVLFETVVDDLGIDYVLNREPRDGQPDGAAAAGDAPQRGGDAIIRDRAIRALEKSIDVSNGRKSSVITVTARADAPEKAQRIVQSFLDAFLALHIRVNRTEGSHQFFVEQSDLIARKLHDARRELADTKSRYGIITIEGQRKNLQDQITATETQAYAAEADLASAEATIARLQAMLAELPERIVSQQVDGHPNPPGDTARQQVFQLEVRERELLARYTERHPLVIAVREQIAEARQRLSEYEADRTQSTSQINPARQAVEMQLLQEQSRAASLAARARALRDQQVRLQRELRELNAQEAEIDGLERQVAILQTEYQAHAERLEQARIGDALHRERISNVNVVQPATFVPQPAAPKMRTIGLLGLFVATAGAIGLAFGCEYLAWLEGAEEAPGSPAEEYPVAGSALDEWTDLAELAERRWWERPPDPGWETREAAAL